MSHESTGSVSECSSFKQVLTASGHVLSRVATLSHHLSFCYGLHRRGTNVASICSRLDCQLGAALGSYENFVEQILSGGSRSLG